MNTDPIYVTFEFNGNLGEEVERVKLGIKGLGDESASTYKRLLADSDEAFQAMSENNRKLAVSIQEDILSLRQLAAARKAADEALKKGSITATAYAETQARLTIQEADLREGIKSNMNLLNESIARDRQVVDSITAKKEALDRLEEAYRKLSASSREGREGEQLLSDIKSLKTELAGLDSAYKAATGGSRGLLDSVSQLPGPVGQTASAISKMTKAAMAFVATPLGMVLAAIAAALAAVSSWFRRTEEGQNALAVGTAAFSAVLNSLLDVADRVGEWLFKAFTKPKAALSDLSEFIKGQFMNRLSALSGMGQALVKIFTGDWKDGFADFGNAVAQFATGIEHAGKKAVDFLSDVNNKATTSMELAKRRNALDVVEREALKEKADLQARLNLLRDKAYDMSVPEKERVKYLKEALAISDKINNKDIAIAKEKHEIQKKQNELSHSGKENKRAEAETYSAWKEAEAKKYSARRELVEQLNTVVRAEETAAQRRSEAEQWLTNKQKELRNEQIKDILDIEERKLNLEQDSFEKRQKQLQLNYERELLDIKIFEAKKLKEAQETAKRIHREQTGSDKGFDFSVYQEQLPEGLRSADIAKEVEEKTTLANFIFDKSEEKLLKELTDKYLAYSDERLEIEKRFNNDIAALKAEREKADTQQQKDLIDRSIAKATAEKGKELMAFDFSRMKETPEYVRAFEDLKNTSTETLTSLLEQLNSMKSKAAEVLAPDQLREYTSTIQDILDELVSRNPFDALASAQKRLADASEKLRQAKTKLDAVMSGKDKTTTLIDANKKYREALDEVVSASNDVEKAQKNIREQTIELYGAISGLGQVIGGATGEIISLIADVGMFVDTTIDGIQLTQKAGMEALSSLEKASVILGIITAAIQLMQSLSSLIPDSHEQYLDFAEKINEINKMRDAVTEYELAVLKARQAEQSWFAKDNLQSLKQAKDINSQILKDYEEKVKEQQAIYQNESGGGWLTTLWKPITWLVDQTYGKLYGFDINKDYEEGTTAAINNLRIETRKKSKGVLGSGIGAKSQKTEDLLTWVKNNPDLTKYGDLFDEKGMINEILANVILEKYGDKLVGQTKETIEALVELKEQYNEYIEQLHEYVSSMYEPLVGNFVSAMWDWFDEGKNALDSFKEYASGTFRDIVSDMLRTIILQNVVGTFGDDMNTFYEQYAGGKIDEAELAKLVADRTGVLADSFEKQLPVLQNVMTTIADTFKDIGVDLRSSSWAMADSIADSLIQGFAEGKRSAGEFADDFEKMLNNAVLQGVKMKALEEPLRQWYESFASAGSSGLTEDKIADLKAQYDKIIEDAARQLEDAEKITGMSINGSTRSTAAKGIAAMSQDSANELNGNFNAMLIYQKNTTEGINSLNTALTQGLATLKNIEQNTSHLEAIGKDMRVVKSGIQELVDKGLIMRKQ